MEDRYIQALKTMEHGTQRDLNDFPSAFSDRLEDLAKSMIHESFTDNDYIKLCEIYYRHYKKSENTKGMMFSILRAQEFMFLKEHRLWQSKYKNIQFTSSSDEMTKVFLAKRKNYFMNQFNDFLKKLAIGSTLVTIFLMILLILIANASFLVGWIISFIIGISIYGTGYFYVFERVYDQQMISLSKHLDKVHRNLDKSIRGN